MAKSYKIVKTIFAISALLILTSLIIMMTLTPPPKPKASAHQSIVINVETSDIGGDFTLINSAGNQVDSQSLKGKLLLIYFGYTRCPDICPASLMEVVTTLDNLGEFENQVQPVFITIDPKRDTPQELDSFFKNFDKRIMALTGTEAQIAEVTKKFKVYSAIAHDDKEHSIDYLVNHSSFYYLLNRDGKLIKYYTPNATGKEMAADIVNTINQQ